MAKKFIKSNATAASGQRQIRSAVDLIPDGLISFSFKYLNVNHDRFNLGGCEANYFLCLVDRLRSISGTPVTQLKRPSRDSLHFHPIDFNETRVSADGFGVPQCEIFDDAAWQFAVTVNEHGRVHGFMIGDIFYVVWFDPDHLLYPRKTPTGN